MLGRTLVVMVVLAGLGAASANGATAPVTGLQSAKKSKRCKSSEVKRKITYTKGRSGRRRSFTACVPRSSLKTPASLPAALRQGRRVAVKLAPKSIARLLRGRAARRVSAADAVTDRALAAGLAPARAATVTHDSDTQTLKGPRGTQTVQHRSGTGWDDAEPNPGADIDVTIETKSTRIDGLSSRKKSTLKLVRTMARCPDAGGVGRGVLKYSQKEARFIDKPGGGHGVIEVLLTFDAEVLVHFNDEAVVTSVEVIGDWAWSEETRISPGRGAAEQRLTRFAVGGAVTGASGPDGRSVKVTTSVTNATSDTMAILGMLFGTLARLVPEDFIGELVSGSASRAGGGVCARIVPDPPTVHIKPGGSVAINAGLNDADGAPLQGSVKALAQRATVTPAEAQADPTARFTYAALSTSPPGHTDTVALTHVSKRGRASAKSVTVIYDDEVSHSYRILDATLDETITGVRPASSFPGCPDFNNRQVNTMSLGLQPSPTGPPGSAGRLFEGPDGFLGTIIASGPATATTTLQGCDLASEPPRPACTTSGSATITRDVSFEITLPKTGPAQLRWSFEFGPTAGLGSEGAGTTCLTPPIGWTTSDFSIGYRTVPREVFEAATPQNLSVAIDLRLTDPNPSGPAEIHAVENYSMTIQRVRDDGSPL